MNEMQAAAGDESASIAALAAALAKAQGQIRAAAKDSVNPHFKSKYADLAAIWSACREPLSANGLAVMQRVGTTQGGVLLTTMLVHSSGEWVKDRCVFPVAQQTPQGYGSAITYARRYALAALVGIAADDDDGEAASALPPQNGTRTATVRAEVSARVAKLATPAPPPKALPKVIDVAPGETEAQALERAKPSSPWQKISFLLLQAGIPKAEMPGLIKDATGKGDRKALDEDDVARVEAAIINRRAENEPPPPSEEFEPGADHA